MRRSFWTATLVFIAAYAAAVLIGVWGGLPFALFAVPAVQITCALVAVIRIVQLRRDGGHTHDAPLYEWQSYGFWLGGLISSSASLAVLFVLTQAV